MLAELYIRNFAIIEDLRLEFDSGFNVLTGETGAGKSIILDAVGLILGGRADKAMVRGDTQAAYVEATLELDPTRQEMVRPVLEAEALENNPVYELVLAREVRANGRTIARVNGRTVNITILQQLGELLVDVHGQGDHLSLLKGSSHIHLLDAYANALPLRMQVAEQMQTLGTLRRELATLQQDERNMADKIDLLTFQVNEIDELELSAGDEETLKAERTRLANAEQLMRHTDEIIHRLNDNDDDVEPSSAIDQLNKAERALKLLAGLDESQDDLLERLQGLIFQVEEIVGETSDYQDSLEFNPERLNEVEERIVSIEKLKMKHRATSVEEILTKRLAMWTQLDSIENRGERKAKVTAEIEKLLKKIGKLAQKLSKQRQKAAADLAQSVETELDALRMNARFQVSFETKADPDGVYVGDQQLACDQTGIDRIEFLISANPGEPLRPLAKVASGGETARLMLALKTALARVDATPTLIFDEIDQGIGARLGHTVGTKLWGLSVLGGHQVIVVTHLAQLAGYGDRHFHVAKQVVDERTQTHVYYLEGQDRINELADMLGKTDDGTVAEDVHSYGMAETIVTEADKLKEQLRGTLTC